MSERIGVCGGCGTRYRIPETFTGASAKCKKCGGVIAISAAPSPAPAAAPAAKPPAAAAARPPPAPASKAPSAPPPKAAGAAAPAARHERIAHGAGHGAHEHEGAERRHGRHGRAAEKKSNPVLIVGVIAAVLIVGGGLGFLLLNQGGGGEQANASTPSTQGGPAETASGGPGTGEPGSAPVQPVEPASGAGGIPVAEATPQAPAGESAPAGGAETKKPEPEPGEEEPVVTKFAFESIERAPGTTDAEWTDMQQIGEGLKSSGKARKRAMEKLLPFGMKAVPILVDSLNGIDLADAQRWMDGYEVATFIQDRLTAETILIPYHGDFSTEPKEIRHNFKVLTSMVEYWNSQARDSELWARLLKKHEEKKAAKGKSSENE
jgi:hypothetical protein